MLVDEFVLALGFVRKHCNHKGVFTEVLEVPL